MEISEVKNADTSQCVRVAVNIRPLITSELLLGCTDCISVVPGEPQVQIGSHSFTYDYVYGGMGLPCSALYDDCVAPLVDALFHGYNATVLAYGQTGSGKTYTMGTNYTGEESNGGIIPKAMESIFRRVEAMKDSTKFFIKVSFIEIFEDKVFDLLDPNSSVFSKAEGASFAKPTMHARVPIRIRETMNEGITLVSVTEVEVMTKEEMATHLSRGSHSRATNLTNMNSQSSQSHAIFTITMEQNKISHCLAGAINDDLGDDILRAKLHLVDLAGFVRAKRTGADGRRFKEGIHINKDLQALGNVISALGDKKKRKGGGHVPYRDSKLTHLLQDSLGRSSKTVMIACVSPADINVEETINTLKYADRAHNSQNKAVINREPMAAQEQRMRSSNISSTSDDGAQKLKEDYLQKLNILESQVSDLKKKQDAQAQLLRQKQKSDEAAKRLQDEIQRIKSQKVQLQHKIKQESEQFRLWKASREKEVLQLKKEGRRNEYEMHKLMALNQRQKMVLHRKTEEASLATKRLKELLESRKASSRETSGAGNGNGPGIQALMQAIEHELEVTVRVHEVRAEYERQMEERAMMAKELARLKEEAYLFKQSNMREGTETLSPGARNSRIFALENMLATSSSTLVSMASQLSEAEERERGFSGRGRWNQVRSLADAKNIMNYLFNLASSSRCLVRDKVVACREKDLEIRDLKEKIVKLSSYGRQLEMQKTELIQQVKSQNSALKKYSTRNAADYSMQDLNNGGHKYDLRKQDQRSSIFLLEDMDTSESEHSDGERTDDEWVAPDNKRLGRKRNSKNGGRSSVTSDQSDPNDSESLKLGRSGEGITDGTANTPSGACCSCSKNSSCKTTKCPCRAAGGSCGSTCSCVPMKCANRESVLNKDSDETPQLEIAERNGSGSGSDETEKSRMLASQGAMLLQSALVEKPAETNDDNGSKRKPLSDIGNTLAKSNAPKPNRRKKWRKSTILLVSNPPPSSQPESADATHKSDNNNNTSDVDIPLKLPRAMRSVASNSGNPLRERNAGKSDVFVNKESAVLAPPSPQKRTSEEKENNGL